MAPVETEYYDLVRTDLIALRLPKCVDRCCLLAWCRDRMRRDGAEKSLQKTSNEGMSGPVKAVDVPVLA
jgi:hypothetical protein